MSDYSDWAMLEKSHMVMVEVHKGQYRKDGVTPYDTHPEAVYDILVGVGVRDVDTLCASRLHDVEEDCGLTRDYLAQEFNPHIADMVHTLTRDVSRGEYKERIANAEFGVKLIKLADFAHNCSTLYKELPEKTIVNKVADSDFYISLADEVCPELGRRIDQDIEPWRGYCEIKGIFIP